MRSVARCAGLVVCGLIAIGSWLSAGELVEIQMTKEIAKPTETEALVYVVRPASAGKAVKFWAFSDTEVIGATKGKTYVFAHVAPGKHVFWVRGENVSALEMEVEAGKTYFLQAKLRMGALKARVKLVPIGERQGMEALKKCRYAVLTDQGRRRGAEIAAEKIAVARDKAAER